MLSVQVYATKKILPGCLILPLREKVGKYYTLVDTVPVEITHWHKIETPVIGVYSTVITDTSAIKKTKKSLIKRILNLFW